MSTLQTKGASGRKLVVTAPTGGLSAGEVYVLRSGANGWCGIVQDNADAGKPTVVEYGHVVEVPKETGTGESFNVGSVVYRDASTGKATAASTGNTKMGAAVMAASTTDDTVWVQLSLN